MSAYRVHISRDNLMFAAGHFVSYDGDKVELLHGHNYRFGVTVEGPLDENAYVFNFVTLKRLMKRLADELDHRMILPRDNPLIGVEPQDDGGVIVRTHGRWYRFPQEDVVILPLPNTTAEMLARHLCGRLRDELRARPDATHLTAIEVTIEETFGQMAVYREELARAENGKRKTESGKRKTENGKRKTENGKRKTENGKRNTKSRSKIQHSCDMRYVLRDT